MTEELEARRVLAVEDAHPEHDGTVLEARDGHEATYDDDGYSL